MEVFNISDFESTIKSFVCNKIKELYPDVDAYGDEVLNDLYINPMISLLKPWVIQNDRLQFQQNLKNANLLSESEMDEIGEGNYFMLRKNGNKASVVLTIYFKGFDITSNETTIIKIPAGVTFMTSEGLSFASSREYIFTKQDLLSSYDSASSSYYININADASEIGKKYNVPINAINLLSTSNSIAYFSSVLNKSAAVGGTDKETNDEYLKRIRNIFTAKNNDTVPGYESLVKEINAAISDVLIVGFRNKFMTRDIIITDSSSTAYISLNSSTCAIDNMDLGTFRLLSGAFSSGAPVPVIGPATVVFIGSFIQKVNVVITADVDDYVFSPVETGDNYHCLDKYLKGVYYPISDTVTDASTKILNLGGKIDIYVDGPKSELRYSQGMINSSDLVIPVLGSISSPELTITLSNSDETTVISRQATLINNDFAGGLYNNYYYYRILASDFSNIDTEDGRNNVIKCDVAGYQPFYYYVGLTKINLDSPLSVFDKSSIINVSAVKYDSINITNIIDDFSIINNSESDEHIGTSAEKSSIVFNPHIATSQGFYIPNLGSSDTNNISSGQIYLEVQYYCNPSLNSLKKYFDDNSNRSVSADLLFFDIKEIELHINLGVKLKTTSVLSKSVVEQEIRKITPKFFLTTTTGSPITISDYVGYLMSNSIINKNTSYILTSKEGSDYQVNIFEKTQDLEIYYRPQLPGEILNVYEFEKAVVDENNFIISFIV